MFYVYFPVLFLLQQIVILTLNWRGVTAQLVTASVMSSSRLRTRCYRCPPTSSSCTNTNTACGTGTAAAAPGTFMSFCLVPSAPGLAPGADLLVWLVPTVPYPTIPYPTLPCIRHRTIRHDTLTIPYPTPSHFIGWDVRSKDLPAYLALLLCFR